MPSDDSCSNGSTKPARGMGWIGKFRRTATQRGENARKASQLECTPNPIPSTSHIPTTHDPLAPQTKTPDTIFLRTSCWRRSASRGPAGRPSPRRRPARRAAPPPPPRPRRRARTGRRRSPRGRCRRRRGRSSRRARAWFRGPRRSGFIDGPIE